jgi:hypothetical protein
MARRRPPRVVVSFGGVDYEMNIAACRLALVRKQVAGELLSMEALADAVGRSRSTTSRFLSGKGSSLAVALAVLDKLQLRFDEVFTPCSL